MSADPQRSEPFNRLSDLADVHGHQLGLRTGHLLVSHHDSQWRDLVELQCKLKAGNTIVEPIRIGDLQDAASRMLVRIAKAAA